ncbi:MAG: hypothetical protein K2J39_13230 [Ruminococcus sp.]|nr:hypothetical protein [Ruminococcus sp.]
MNNSQAILSILLQYIQKNGTTEKQCLIDCNINTSFLTDWKGGRLKNPSYDKIVKLAGYLNIDLNLLFLGENNSKTSELTDDEQELIESYRLLTDDSKEEASKRIEELASGIVSGTNEDRQNIFKPSYYSDLREKEMLMLFRSLSEHEQERLIGRAELMAEQTKLGENVG